MSRSAIMSRPAIKSRPATKNLLLSVLLFTLAALFAGLPVGLPVGKLIAQDADPAGITDSKAQTPEQSTGMFRVLDDLRFDQLLAEPQIAQPVFLNFDERGRMWVVEYRQYPKPAGLKELSRDKYFRTVYDKIPPAPPNHDRGEDRISIHEDTNGDGEYDSHKVFLDGLNICTAVERGRGGVFVLHPPYLLFYPDADNDDVPDGDPEVLLEGFGIEDTHSVVNSLRWGPDGWLYAAQGSTVTGNVRRPGSDAQPVKTMGQLIWRYHVESKTYEVFAEGGGNAFGLEIDDQGNMFSGHNGGNTRGFHYVQGAYLQKGFSKHGPLSNPYAFGYFPQMPHGNVPRFTHNFVIYQDQTLPEKYDGKLFGIEPLQGQVTHTKMIPRGTTFRTEDIDRAVASDDRWFRPVDIKVGPDGAIYVCDWYDAQTSHLQNSVGNLDTKRGRVYRLTAKDAVPVKQSDLTQLKTVELAALAIDGTRWQRQTALRLLGDRRRILSSEEESKLSDFVDRRLQELSQSESKVSQRQMLDLVWVTWNSGQFERCLDRLWNVKSPAAREWVVRLLCDTGRLSDQLAEKIAALADVEPDANVRSQLACSAKRLPVHQCMPIVEALITNPHGRSSDIKDPYLPLLIWWALESKSEQRPESPIVVWKNLGEHQQLPLAQEFLAERLMRRYAAAGRRQDFLRCAELLNATGDPTTVKRMLKGFEEGVAGRSLADLPDEMMKALAKSGAQSLQLDLRLGTDDAFANAVKAIHDANTEAKTKLELTEILGQLQEPDAVDVLLELVGAKTDPELAHAAILSLQNYDEDRIGRHVSDALPQLDEETLPVAIRMLTARQSWTEDLMALVSGGDLPPSRISRADLQRALLHKSPEIRATIKETFGEIDGVSSEQMVAEINQYLEELQTGETDRYAGKKLFGEHCAKCHEFFDQGAMVGPSLTGYQRNDLRNMLISVVNPSAEIREGFENFLVETIDGRVLTGFKFDEDPRVVVLRGADGSNITVAKDDIDYIEAQAASLMPEGLLSGLSAQQRRDLFAYLQSTQPLND